MNAQTQRVVVQGPAGALQCALDAPAAGAVQGVAVLCHPHPLFGGTMDNKVVHTLARALLHCGWRTVRFNFRGVGESAGAWDEGRGEVDDALAVIAAQRADGEALVLGGFSFGGYVAACAAARVAAHGVDASPAQPARRLVLVAPATSRFEVPPVPADTIVIQGDADEVVPVSATLDWARPQGLSVVQVPGVGHFFHGQLPLLRSLIERELAR